MARTGDSVSTTDLIVPGTGEVLSLDAPTNELGEAFREMQRWEVEFRVARARVRDELLKRMDHELMRSLELDGLFFECDAPGQVEYDPDALSVVLGGLVGGGKISTEAAKQACRTEEILKVSKRGVDKLLQAPALSDEDRAAIRACARPSSKPRRLQVKRAEDR